MKPIFAICGAVGREPRLLETVNDERSDLIVVFYDQHSHARFPTLELSLCYPTNPSRLITILETDESQMRNCSEFSTLDTMNSSSAARPPTKRIFVTLSVSFQESQKLLLEYEREESSPSFG